MLRRFWKLGIREIAVLTICGVIVTILSGCGGEEVTVTTVTVPGDAGRPMIDGGQPTPPYLLTILDRDYQSIHFEMTDEVSTLTGPARIEVDTGIVTANDYLRLKVVCPGVPPRGNECSTEETVIDGVLYQNKRTGNTMSIIPGTDLSIDKHVAYLP